MRTGRRTARSASIIPGHETTPGTRWPPSQVEPFELRNGEYAASGQVSISGPLSEVTKTIVLSSCPVASSSATSRPTMSSSSMIVSLYGCFAGDVPRNRGWG